MIGDIQHSDIDLSSLDYQHLSFILNTTMYLTKRDYSGTNKLIKPQCLMKIINKTAIIILLHYIHFFKVSLSKSMPLILQINVFPSIDLSDALFSGVPSGLSSLKVL